MSKFGNLKKLEVTAKNTAELTLYQIEGEPVLILSPATEVNKPYFNALLKRSRKNQRRIAAGNFSADLIKENRDNDRELYPQFVMRGWKDIDKVCGEELDPTPDNFRDFLDSLPDYIFDEIRSFSTDSQNFVELSFDVEESSGNLPND